MDVVAFGDYGADYSTLYVLLASKITNAVPEIHLEKTDKKLSLEMGAKAKKKPL